MILKGVGERRTKSESEFAGLKLLILAERRSCILAVVYRLHPSFFISSAADRETRLLNAKCFCQHIIFYLRHT